MQSKTRPSDQEEMKGEFFSSFKVYFFYIMISPVNLLKYTKRNDKCFAANQLHDAANLLSNFPLHEANRLHYAAKRLCSFSPEPTQLP